MFDSRQGYTLKRRLRIRTLEIGVAANYAELYESAQPEVILRVLTHKVMFGLTFAINTLISSLL
jgi:hypothetical protein